MNQEKLQQLRIRAEAKQRSSGSLWWIFLGVAAVTATAVFYMWPRSTDNLRLFTGQDGAKRTTTGETPSTASAAASNPGATSSAKSAVSPAVTPGQVAGSVLTVSGYIVNRERIELSPRFLGVVKWIGVKKGDAVTNGQVVVLLDDAEYRARKRETEGRLARSKVAVAQAVLDLQRAESLVREKVEMRKALDDARLQVESTRASVSEIEGQLDLVAAMIEWCVIRSPIDGVVLEKLVDPNELVVPQSFGGTRGPSTALISVGDLKDLQVEIDLNESDLSKVFLNQACKISPEAYLDRTYDGYVAEIAPEANRQKGTLQVKVQIRTPDRYLTPELSAKVDFLPK